MRRGRQRLGKRFGLVFGALVVLLAATALAAAVALRNHREVVRERRDVDAGAIDAVHQITEGLMDQRVAQRSYVLTGAPKFLTDYEAGRQRELAALAVVRALAAHVEGLESQLDTIGGATDEWRAVADEEMAAADAGDDARVVELVSDPAAAATFDRARAVILEADDLLDRYVESLDGRVDRSTRWVSVLALSGLLVGLGLFVVTMWELRRVVSGPLTELAEAVDDVASGNLDREIPVGGFGEIGVVSAGAEAMRRRLLEEIDRSVRTSVLAAEQAERERLAGELHDDAVQTAYAAQLRLAVASAKVPDPDTAASLDQVASSLGALQQRLRSLMFRLHPASLDADGLPAAVQDLLDESFHGTSTATTLEVAPGIDLDERMASLAFRLLAEAVRNASKHAGASSVIVRVSPHAGGASGEVIDDGVGFDLGAPAPSGHHGVEISRSLAEAVGGWWTVTSAPGTGTTVRFWVPG